MRKRSIDRLNVIVVVLLCDGDRNPMISRICHLDSIQLQVAAMMILAILINVFQASIADEIVERSMGPFDICRLPSQLDLAFVS